MTRSVLQVSSIKASYQKLKDLPFGAAIFSRLFAWMVPYSGSISPKIEKLEPGYAKISMKDRRRVRNHLKSIHAVALMNLAEAATGLALHYDLRADLRGILTNLSMEYLKKARGTLYVEATCETPDSNDRKSYVVMANIYDESGTIVAKATATWLFGPKS